jgi:hypothetical protein
MATLIETRTAPKGRTWKVAVDGRDHGETLEDILQWVKYSCRGRVHWSKTRFRDPRNSHKFYPSRQRNFKDGYLMITVWFARKADAALFKLWWA